MSILDDDLTIVQDMYASANSVLIDKDFDWNRLLSDQRAYNVARINGHMFVGKLKKVLNKKNELLKTKSAFVSLTQPICIIDCRKIKDGDALVFLEKLSQIPKALKPIVVIQNITEIAPNISDEKETYRLLIHIWDKKKCRLKNAEGIFFTIRPANFVVYRTWEDETWSSLAKIWGTKYNIKANSRRR